MNITNEDIGTLTFIQKGTYGAVYTDGEKKYKLYNPYVKNWYDSREDNPCFYISKRKYRILSRRSSKIKYTDTNVEPLYLDGHFAGIVQNFVVGDILRNHKNDRCSLKVKESYDLVRNAKELGRNCIYIPDIKDNNVIVDNFGNVRIIDIDDIRTHVRIFPSLIMKAYTMLSLKKTVYEFLCYNHQQFPSNVVSRLEITSEYKSKTKNIFSYEGINEFIKYFDEDKNIVIINVQDIKTLDIEKFKLFIEMYDTKVVISVSEDFVDLFDKEIIKSIKLLEENGIKIFDIYDYKGDSYISEFEYASTHKSTKCYTYSNNKLSGCIVQ